MDGLLEQVVIQFPVVVILLYNNIRQEKRMDALMQSVLNCLNSQKKDENDHTYTYP